MDDNIACHRSVIAIGNERSRKRTLAEATPVNEDIFNTAIRGISWKEVGVTSQREIEKTVRNTVARGKLKGSETLKAKVTLTLERHRSHACGGRRYQAGVSKSTPLILRTQAELASRRMKPKASAGLIVRDAPSALPAP